VKGVLSVLWSVLVVTSVIFLLLFAFAAITVMPQARAAMMNIKQKAQFSSMWAAAELFKDSRGSYPPSDANDPTGKPYCGAMKLAEALMGRDLLGFQPRSAFRCDGLDPDTLMVLYPTNPSQADLKSRWGPYLARENANAWKLANVFGKGNTGPFPEDAYVLCDTFERKRPGGKKTGMPILYYRANPRGTSHRPGDPNNIYNSADNQALIALGVPGRPGKTHPLVDPNQFYEATQDDRVATQVRPFREDLFILISAGRDGLYGTADDTYNFEPSLRRR
jgi:hypothetical protein